jgi:hypothetical protein
MKKLFILCFSLIITYALTAQEVYPDSTVTNFFKRETGTVAADGGLTVLLADGRVLWLFGDTYKDDYDPVTKTTPCLFGANNSVLLQPFGNWDRNFTPTLPGSKGTQSFFKDGPDDFIWPVNGFQQGDTVYVICLNLHKTGSGAYDMKTLPPTWAKIYLPAIKVVAYTPLQDLNGIGFGQGFIKENGFVYTYGLKDAKLYVARFPDSNPNSAWQFWDGKSWQGDIHKIAVAADAPGFSTFFTKVKDKYVYLSTEFSLACDNGKDIYASTSDNLTGPFTKRKVIYTIPNDKDGHRPFFYGPNAHPEYVNSKDELLITYSINGYAPCIPTCVDGKFDPNNYRLRAIRVPLKLIDEGL